MVSRGVLFERWVARDTLGLTQLFVLLGRAVDVADEYLLGIFELLTEEIPIRLHLLAVASPGSLEFHKSRLRAEDFLVEVLRCQLNRFALSTNAEAQHDDESCGSHVIRLAALVVDRKDDPMSDVVKLECRFWLTK
jgi:hypothetical protein